MLPLVIVSFTYYIRHKRKIVAYFNQLFGTILIKDVTSPTVDISTNMITDSLSRGKIDSIIRGNFMELTKQLRIIRKNIWSKLDNNYDKKEHSSVDPSIEMDETGNGSGLDSKQGYCYIGIDRGYRSCVYADENDVCISNNIFPTMEKCVNF
jgi:hypothetical protein